MRLLKLFGFFVASYLIGSIALASDTPINQQQLQTYVLESYTLPTSKVKTSGQQVLGQQPCLGPQPYLKLAPFSEILTDRFGARFSLGLPNIICPFGVRFDLDYGRQSKVSSGTLAYSLQAIYDFPLAYGFKAYTGAGLSYQLKGLSAIHEATVSGIYVSMLVGIDFDFSARFGVFSEFMYDTYLDPHPGVPDSLDLGYHTSYPSLAFGMKVRF